MVYAPPTPRSVRDKNKVDAQRRFRKKGTGIQNFLFFLNEDRRLTMATHNSEGVYDKFMLVKDFDMMEMCVYMTSLEIYITEVVTLSEPDEEDLYQILYDGKIICSDTVANMIEKYSFEKVLTDAAKMYLMEKGYD
jgi:hypothetical protein